MREWLESLDAGGGADPVVARIVLLVLAGYVTVLVMTALRRMLAGAGPLELLRAGLTELPPLRGLMHVLHGSLWIVLLGGVVVSVKGIVLVFLHHSDHDVWSAERIVSALVCCAATVLVGFLRALFHTHVIDARPSAAVAVDVRLRHRKGAPPLHLLDTLGSERFPNQVHPHWKRDLVVRGLILLANVACIVLCVLHWENAEPYLPRPLLGLLDSSHAFALLCVGAYACAVLFTLTITCNRAYLLVPFYRAQVFTGVLAWGALQLPLHAADAQVSLVCIVVCASGWGVRMFQDLRAATRYRAQQRVSVPIARTIAAQADFLDEVLRDRGCALPSLDEDALSQRVARGADNLEEADFLVTPRFSRYMRVGEIHDRACAVASFRFLTVGRYTELGASWPTYAPLCHPQVPVWNEVEFPLDVPDGFVNWLDPLPLGDEWNVVDTCGTCGGSGRVRETTYETEYHTVYASDGTSHTESRTVTKERWVTCGTCGGSGRLAYQQILCTRWRRLLPAHTEPALPMAELVEDAEEACWFQRPVVENRQPARAPPRSTIADPHLLQRVSRAADALTKEARAHAPRVKELLDGRIYRADFVVQGFHLMHVRFGHIGRSGWFFGRRPEFHFPRLPLSWSRLGTAVFLPPLALLTWALTLGLMVAAFVAVT